VLGLALIVLQGFAPLQDSVYLGTVADSFNVPREVVYAVAWNETRDGRRWDARGSGIVDSIWVGDILRIRRTCRELGRFQLSPCIPWVKRLNDPVCTVQRLKSDYAVGVHCGVSNLAWLGRRYGNWLTVLQRQNGAGPLAAEYVNRALAYIGWRHLR
jgi:hypothetical protein